MLRAPPVLIAVVIAAGAARNSRAEPGAADPAFSASLEYSAPPTCPDADDFKAVVVRRLGFDPFNGASHRVLVAITAGERLDGRLVWHDSQGRWAGDQSFPTRTQDCDELARTMGFALAVQIHLLMTGQSTSPSNRQAAEADPAPPKDLPRPTSPSTPGPRPGTEPGESNEKADAASESPDETRWAFALGAGSSLGLGMSPSATALGRVFGSAGRGAASLELGGEFSTETNEYRADGAGFSQRALVASAAVCGTEGPWSACLVSKAGVVKIAGERVDVSESPTGALFQGGLRLMARQRFRSVFLGGRAEALWNLTPWTVTLDGLAVWNAPAIAGTLGVDVGVIFR